MSAEVVPMGEQPAPNVVVALSRVIRDLPAIGKDGRASQAQGGYAYRGIEQITKEVGPLLARHGIVIAPSGIEWGTPREITINGKPWTDERCAVSYRAYGPGGPSDFIEVGPIPSLGRDNADKGANKCMTQAWKYALTQLLCIGDGKDDSDGTTHEADARPDPAKADLDAFFRAMNDEAESVQDAVREWWRGYDKDTGSAAHALIEGRRVRDDARIETGSPSQGPVISSVTSQIEAHASLPPADAEMAVASAPCEFCGSARSKRVLNASRVSVCADAKGCEERAAKRDLENPCSFEDCPEPAVDAGSGMCALHAPF